MCSQRGKATHLGRVFPSSCTRIPTVSRLPRSRAQRASWRTGAPHQPGEGRRRALAPALGGTGGGVVLGPPLAASRPAAAQLAGAARLDAGTVRAGPAQIEVMAVYTSITDA